MPEPAERIQPEQEATDRVPVARGFVFVSGCMSAQILRAEGCHIAPAQAPKIYAWANQHDVNLIHLPCPETHFLGVDRKKHGKKWYEARDGFRDTCRTLAKGPAQMAADLERSRGAVLLAVIGVTSSPACGATQGNNPYMPWGIYMDELRSELESVGLRPLFVSIDPRHHKKMDADLERIAALGIEADSNDPA